MQVVAFDHEDFIDRIFPSHGKGPFSILSVDLRPSSTKQSLFIIQECSIEEEISVKTTPASMNVRNPRTGENDYTFNPTPVEDVQSEAKGNEMLDPKHM